MPKIVYTAQQNKTFELLPDGDYLLEVVDSEPCFSQAPKTKGAEQFELRLKSVEHGTDFTEWLTFHPSLEWKIDTFLSCMNYPVAKGQEVEIAAEDVIGLRGWARVGHYEKGDKKYNQVRIWYTDKQKYERAVPAAVAAQTEPDSEETPWL